MPNNTEEIAGTKLKPGMLVDAEQGWREVVDVNANATRIVVTFKGPRGGNRTMTLPPDSMVRVIDEHVETDPDTVDTPMPPLGIPSRGGRREDEAGTTEG